FVTRYGFGNRRPGYPMSGGFHLHDLAPGRRCWDRLTRISKGLQVKLYTLSNELQNFATRITNGHAAGQVRHIGAVVGLALFDDDEEFHGGSYGFFNPARLRILPSVPTGMSTPGLPATVTVPDFAEC